MSSSAFSNNYIYNFTGIFIHITSKFPYRLHQGLKSGSFFSFFHIELQDSLCIDITQNENFDLYFVLTAMFRNIYAVKSAHLITQTRL